MKKVSAKATVIFTKLLGKKNYIIKKQTRADNQLLVEYSTDIDDALQYANEQEAENFIKRIHNPHNRIYETEPAQLDKKSIAPSKLPKQKVA